MGYLDNLIYTTRLAMQLLRTNTQRQQQKKLTIFDQGKSSCGVGFPENENT